MLALFHAFAGFSENRFADNSDDTIGGGSQ
jgi:hypothetical protein